eukprot:s862_g12.t1
MPVEEVSGDLLSCEEQYIVQQSNCVTDYAAGLAAAIAEKFPHADVYKASARQDRGTEKSGDVPGTIAVLGGPCAATGQEQRGVINLFGQWAPGKPRAGPATAEYKGKKAAPGVIDDEKQRMEWFRKGLLDIAEIPGLESIAFPHQIGCGLAGGNWADYTKALDEFAALMAEKNVKVKVYKMVEASWLLKAREMAEAETLVTNEMQQAACPRFVLDLHTPDWSKW